MIGKSIVKSFALVMALCGTVVFAQEVDFAIIPEATTDVTSEVRELAESPGDVPDKYKEIASRPGRSLGDKMASGIMDWDTLLDYVVYLVKFLSQLGLLIGACMFIYAGYMYASDIMTGKGESTANNAVKYAIQGVVVLSFSYAILKILTNMFIE